MQSKENGREGWWKWGREMVNTVHSFVRRVFVSSEVCREGERADLSIASWITPWVAGTWGTTGPLPPPLLRYHPLSHWLPCTSGVTVENPKHLAGKQQPNAIVEASSMKVAESALLRWAGCMIMCWEWPFLPSASREQHQGRSQKLDYGACRRLQKAHSRGRRDREKLGQRAMRAEQVELVITSWQQSSKRFPPMLIRTSPSEFTSTWLVSASLWRLFIIIKPKANASESHEVCALFLVQTYNWQSMLYHWSILSLIDSKGSLM